MKSKLLVASLISLFAFLTGCGDNAAEQKAQQEREHTKKALQPVDKSAFDRTFENKPTQNQAPNK